MFKRLDNMESVFERFIKSAPDLESLLNSDFAYEQGYVRYIDAQKRIHGANHLGDLFAHEIEPVVKFEGFEKYDIDYFMACQAIAIRLDHFGPVTCHLFKSPAEATSFPLHSDPDRVVIVMLEGQKRFRNHEEDVLLTAGDFILIPKHYPHEAINVTDNLMLAIGLESFTREKL